MAIYHDIEEICYGPEGGMPAISRVFFCIRHKLLRDGLGQKAIGHSFIMQKTGLTKRQVITVCKKLQEMGLIIIVQNKKTTEWGTTQYSENSYELNPEKFGELYNWYKNNPTVRVYGKDKTGSYSKRGVVPDQTPGVVPDLTPGVVHNQTPGKDLKISELLEKMRSNNPSSNNPSLNNPSKIEEFFTQDKGSGTHWNHLHIPKHLQVEWAKETHQEIDLLVWYDQKYGRKVE